MLYWSLSFWLTSRWCLRCKCFTFKLMAYRIISRMLMCNILFLIYTYYKLVAVTIEIFGCRDNSSINASCINLRVCMLSLVWLQLCSSIHGIFQARILESVIIFYSRGSSQPRHLTHVSCISCISRQILYYWATWLATRKYIQSHSSFPEILKSS